MSTATVTPAQNRWVQLGLSGLTWTVFFGSIVVMLVSTGFSLDDRSDYVGVIILLLFSTAILRLVVTAVREKGRRGPRLALAAGLVLWATGSIMLNIGGDAASTSFPSAAEVFFLLSYVGFAASLVLDRRRGQALGVAVWLETVIICGGAASVAGFVIASPLGDLFGRTGAPLLIALLFPLLNVLLALIVAGQAVLGQRALDRASLTLLGGWLVLTLADGGLVMLLAAGTYIVGNVFDALYLLGFTLLVAGACGPAGTPGRDGSSRARGLVMAGAGAIAIAVLAFNPAQAGEWYVTVPAVLTLSAAGARLLQALRQAQDAAEARRLSLTDDLTGLPNRRAVLESVDNDLKSDGPLSLMLLDLDGFKDVNDSLGHSAGDQVLAMVGERLEVAVAGAGMLARLGGDEFAVVCSGHDQPDPEHLAATLLETLAPPIQVDGLSLVTRASIGITTRQPGDGSAIDLLRRADIAMYKAKSGRTGLSVYDPASDSFSRDRLDMLAQLRNAIATDEVVVWYQPQVDTRTRQVVAFEALVRWEHPVLGVLSPFHFLPDARRAGLMPAVTERVMQLVIADAQRWIVTGGLPITLSFNCAPPELLGGSLLPQLYAALEEATLPPDTIVVEVTEDSFVSDPEQARVVLRDLRAHGVQVAIDDYGTGFSSLAYLRDLPVQELKMDRSFVSTVESDPRSRVIVESTCQMAHAMGLRLVGEGIEDEETAMALHHLGVDILQGYHFAKPMPADEVVGWLHEYESSLSESTNAGLVPGPRGA